MSNSDRKLAAWKRRTERDIRVAITDEVTRETVEAAQACIDKMRSNLVDGMVREDDVLVAASCVIGGIIDDSAVGLALDEVIPLREAESVKQDARFHAEGIDLAATAVEGLEHRPERDRGPIWIASRLRELAATMRRNSRKADQT